MKKENTKEKDARIKKKIVGWRAFSATYVVMLFLVGVQTGIIILPVFNAIQPVWQVMIIMLYWALIALTLILLINWQIRTSYDRPVRKLSSAAKKVAEGDFSVYLEPVHTPDRYNYIDVLFTDFNVMVQELGSIETLKNDFVANVSHEIKTPLSIINNYTYMLKNEDLPVEVQQEYMDTILKATENLSSLVSDILRLNKLENQEIERVENEFDLCRQLCDCALQYEGYWEEKNIDFTIQIEDKAVIKTDENMLEIVWNNLLSNAFKYTREGGKIELVQTSENDVVVVRVTDTGCGMDSETINHVFDKFYQADTSRACEGNGLGLALALRVMEKLGGTLSVQSEWGKGSTFTATIPVEYHKS